MPFSGPIAVKLRDKHMNAANAKVVLKYASAMIGSKASSWIEGALLLLGSFVVDPSIAFAIGYYAWMGTR
jgi:hypothetical protein